MCNNNDSEILLARMIGNVGGQVKTNYANVKALTELLIEKGVLTQQELDERFGRIYDKESEELIEFFTTGEKKD